MSSCNKLEIIRMIELFTNVLTKWVSSSSWRNTPTTSVIRVRPEEITNWTFGWHFHDSVELVDLIEGINWWRETTVEAEDVSFNNCGQRQVIKQACEVLPNIGISVFSKALIIESIDLSDLLAFVITSQDGNSVWVSYLEADKERNCLNWVISSVDVITHKKIVVVRELSTDFK